jgi:IS30 family transposase
VVWQPTGRWVRLLNVLVEPPSTVSREVARNGGRDTYRAHQADREAFRCARRPKCSKLFDNDVLRGVVEEKLADRCSPQQISGWLSELLWNATPVM